MIRSFCQSSAIRVLLLASFLLISSTGFTQIIGTAQVAFSNSPAATAFAEIEALYDVRISYVDSLLAGKTLNLPAKERTLKELLDEVSDALGLRFDFINERYIITNEGDTFANDYQHLDEVVLTSYLTRGISKNKDASFRIRPKELQILPGLVEADIMESIQQLPGVVSPDETATGLNVRGGTPDQNQIIWDGITIYHNGHFFGLISTFNPNITENVMFYNKGVHPRFGSRVSSVIDITTLNTIKNGSGGAFGFNGINLDAYADVPLIKDKLGLMLSFRKSYHGLIETGTFEKLEQKAFQATTIQEDSNSEEDFSFKDYTVKIDFNLNDKNAFSASAIHIDNDLNHLYTRADNSTSFKDVLETENDGFSLNWKNKWSGKATLNTAFSHSYYSLDYSFSTLEDQQDVSEFYKSNDLNETYFSTELAVKPRPGEEYSFGYQASLKNVRYAVTETTDVVYDLDSDDASVNTNSLFANYSKRNSGFLDFDAGLRANYYEQLNTVKLEPRLQVLKNITENVRLQLTAESRNQIISQIDETVLSSLSLEKKLWKLSDGDRTPIIHSDQLSLGVIYQKDGWSLDMDTYYKNVKGVSSLSLGFLDSMETRFRNGNQKILGADFYLKKDFKHLKTWISYSLSQIQNRYDGINNNNYFTASNEIARVFTTSVAYKSRNLEVALGWKWHSGAPYTLLTENPAGDNYVIEELNAESLPDYHRLDLSAVYNFALARESKIRAKAGFSILNLYGRKNHLSRSYIGNNIENDPIVVVDKYSLGLTPNFLFRVFW